jgi:hypothetical protein
MMAIFKKNRGINNLSAAEIDVLLALVQGWTLKAHRHLDGQKECILHSLSYQQRTLECVIVEQLSQRGFIDSNKKFPAATFLLTEKGRQQVRNLQGNRVENPLTAKNF